MQNPESTQFGTRRVSPSKKTRLVRGVFDSVAENYDLMNDLMSGGLHRLWKDRFVRMIRPKPGMRILDVAGGTGDIAFRLHKKIQHPTSNIQHPITICDLTTHMLRVGRDRAIDKGWLNDFEWVTGNAESLPFPDASFDLYTIAFGLRNVTDKQAALASMRRVLKPGGKLLVLEFSKPAELLKPVYDLYSFKVLPLMGKLVADDEESYRYLAESIRMHPDQESLLAMMQDAGFERCRYHNLSGGIVALHIGYRI